MTEPAGLTCMHNPAIFPCFNKLCGKSYVGKTLSMLMQDAAARGAVRLLAVLGEGHIGIGQTRRAKAPGHTYPITPLHYAAT